MNARCVNQVSDYLIYWFHLIWEKIMTVLCLVSKEKGYYKRKSEGDGLHFVSGYGRSSDRRTVVQTHIF